MTTRAVTANDLRQLYVEAPDHLATAVLERLGIAEGHYVVFDGPTGPLFVIFGAAGISRVVPVSAVKGGEPGLAVYHRERGGQSLSPARRPPAGLATALRTGRATALRYDLEALTQFERAVLTKALEIPAGEVRPYGWIAREIGRPKAVRAVGSALGRNPVPVLIPCHRVLRSDGRVGEYAFGTAMKRALLSAEGVDLDRLERLAAGGTRYVASDTTGVFCVPSCERARRITPAHQVAFASDGAARDAGYRPCPRCRPAPVGVAS